MTGGGRCLPRGDRSQGEGQTVRRMEPVELPAASGGCSDSRQGYDRDWPTPAPLCGHHREQLSTVGHSQYGRHQCRVGNLNLNLWKIFLILIYRGIAAGICSGLNGEDIARICIDCKADIIVVEHEALLKKVKDILILISLLNISSSDSPYSTQTSTAQGHHSVLRSSSAIRPEEAS